LIWPIWCIECTFAWFCNRPGCLQQQPIQCEVKRSCVVCLGTVVIAAQDIP
jgi:hypothetical protein